jgi:hypothetical protein
MAKFAGGTRVDTKKYLVIKAGPHRDVRVATLVLEAKLGRKLRPDEDAHHINGNTLDCGEFGSNLEARSNKQRQFLKQREEQERRAWEAEFGSIDELGSTDFRPDEFEGSSPHAQDSNAG